jgi:hypothetical protein
VYGLLLVIPDDLLDKALLAITERKGITVLEVGDWKYRNYFCLSERFDHQDQLPQVIGQVPRGADHPSPICQTHGRALSIALSSLSQMSIHVTAWEREGDTKRTMVSGSVQG